MVELVEGGDVAGLYVRDNFPGLLFQRVPSDGGIRRSLDLLGFGGASGHKQDDDDAEDFGFHMD
jgi:hypothetical protein